MDAYLAKFPETVQTFNNNTTRAKLEVKDGGTAEGGIAGVATYWNKFKKASEGIVKKQLPSVKRKSVLNASPYAAATATPTVRAIIEDDDDAETMDLGDFLS